MRILATLLNAINTTLPLDPAKFKALADEFLEIFHKSKISWNVLNPSLHMLLVHGHDLIRYFNAAIGLFSEEGPEANNKIIRKLKTFQFDPLLQLQNNFVDTSSYFHFLSIAFRYFHLLS